jgi:hypothetical protein
MIPVAVLRTAEYRSPVAYRRCNPVLGATVFACLLVLAALALAAAQAPRADAATPNKTACEHFTVSPHTVRIDGFVDNTNGLTGEIRVAKKGKKAQAQPPLFEVAGDLEGAGGSIPASSVSISNPHAPLIGRAERAIPVSVQNVSVAGTYKGTIRLARGGCTIPLELNVATPADLSLGGSGATPLSLDVTRCASWTCGPGDVLDFLAPSHSVRDSVGVEVVNSSPAQVDVTGAGVVLGGDPGGRIPDPFSVFLDGSEGLASSPLPLEGNAPSPLPDLILNRDQLEPGHYAATIFLALKGTKTPISLPIGLDVKDGPFLALLALLFALAVQELARWLMRRAPSHVELAKLRRLRLTLDSADLAFLGPRLKLAEMRALDGYSDEAAEERGAIARDARDLEQARAFEDELRSIQGGQLPQNLRLAVQRVRIEASKTNNRAGIDSALSDLQIAAEQALRERGLTYGAQIRDAPSNQNRAFALASDARQRCFEIKDRISSALLRTGISWLPRLVGALLIALFVLAGLMALYYSNSTFGANPVLDYGSLVIWGAAAVALRAVLGLTDPKAEPTT